MLIVSFAWTTSALLAGLKDITRRDWPDSHARKFKPHETVQAYDKSPIVGGKCCAIVRTVELHREPLQRLVDEPEYGRRELVREGNLWPDVPAFLCLFGKLKNGHPYRYEFKLEEIKGAQTPLSFRDPVLDAHEQFCRLTGQQLKLSIYQSYWKELLSTHGFTPDDVTLTARYILRQIKAGKRHEGHLKIHQFANPVYFNTDLELAKQAMPTARSPRPVTPAPSAPQEPAANVDLARFGELKSKLRGGPASSE